MCPHLGQRRYSAMILMSVTPSSRLPFSKMRRILESFTERGADYAGSPIQKQPDFGHV